MLRLIAVILLAAFGTAARATDLPIFDAHIHYSHDARDVLAPAQAIAILRKAGLRRALVSSSGDEGTQQLLALAPELILPELRPYRRRGDLGTWTRDDSVVAYVEERLKAAKYVSIGEFHVYGADVETPVVKRIVALANEHKLFLHAHSDADAVERIFRLDPQARVLWAHAGFEPPGRVRQMLARYPRLWCDLAFRNDPASGGKVAPEWRALFETFPDRFMVGTDTYTPERWYYVEDHAKWARGWLKDLPADLAERIAFRNGEALFGKD
ncbi:MAG: amidohydrolase family protein [Hyphomicrobiaceae bacterium]